MARSTSTAIRSRHSTRARSQRCSASPTGSREPTRRKRRRGAPPADRMTSPAPEGGRATQGGGTLARQLGEVWAEGDLNRALERAAKMLAGITGAKVSALFIVSDEGVAGEAWHPEPPEMERRLRYQRAALQGPHPDPRESPGPGVSVVRVSIPTNTSMPER